MATLGIEEITENAIRAVARDCGSLSIECSDVAGYVEGVAERIGEHLKVLDTLEEVTTRLLADQARVSDSTDEARLLSEQAKAKLEAGREAIVPAISPVAPRVSWASFFTSAATTAKERPASPARAASIVALRASMLVLLAIVSMLEETF